MKEIINKKMLEEAGVLLIAIVMVLSTVTVASDTDNERAVSLTRCAKESNHMIFGGERMHSDRALLWDNGDPDGRNGLSCCYWSSYPMDREIVDDFNINENNWSIDGGHFRIVTHKGLTAEFIDGINVFFYGDIGNKPSVNCYAERIAEFDAYNTGNYYFHRPEVAIDVTFDTVELTNGKWWVCFQTVLEDSSYWLTSESYGRNVWASLPDLGYPKWTEGYIIFKDYYDVSFKLFRSNQPPEKPERPDGPTEGFIGVEYTFSTNTTDPDGDHIYYMWEWNDSTPSKWLGPFDSGEYAEASHTWNKSGIYNVTVKAKDVYDFESNWSDPLTIHISDRPILEIGNISGGLFKVSAVIRNSGGIDASIVNWSIILDGGFIPLGKNTSGNIVSIPAGDERPISSSFIFGFGKTVVMVSAKTDGSSDTAERDAFVLMFFIILKE